MSFTGGITTNLTINLNSSDLAPEVKNADGRSTVNWSGNDIDKVQDTGTGDDQITGNDAGNYIQSVGFDPTVGVISGGADTVRAGEGGDTIFVDDNARPSSLMVFRSLRQMKAHEVELRITVILGSSV